MAGALAHVWRVVVRLVTYVSSFCSALRLSSSRSSLPSAVSGPSGSAWTSWKSFLTAGPKRARRQSHAALELLEKFRQGPETHSEWNLFLWRATFPLVSLVLLTLLCIVAQFGHAVYSFVVNPVWYYCNFSLVVTPFLVVFRFKVLDEAVDEQAQTKLWQGLAAVSAAISAIEWYISVPTSRYSWIVGNTLFGIVALGAVPLFLSMQTRTARSQYDALIMEQEQSSAMPGVPEEEVSFAGHAGSEPEDLAVELGKEQCHAAAMKGFDKLEVIKLRTSHERGKQ
ncbi:hypothetical protein PHYBOEH_002974 [Phytophthora boehmeriae]|uniref:Transmembrane protein n=1 Tax=Phytophthora boehmeriae TaxID=109152 RepID=A0A8T1X608_9STRA|nr:hypothetical protein PHYBOEH_002974 [Phytophthora boehmeriae]